MSYSFANAILKLSLSATKKAVMSVLSIRADENGCCYPSITRIMSDTNLGRTTVIRALNALVSEGLIAKTRRVRKDGSYSSNTYQIIMDAVVSLTQKAVEVVTDVIEDTVDVAVSVAKKASKAGGSISEKQEQKRVDLDDYEQFTAIRANICNRAIELYPAADPYDVMNAVQEQLEYWSEVADKNKHMTLTIGKLRYSVLKHEKEFFTFLNNRNVVIDNSMSLDTCILLG